METQESRAARMVPTHARILSYFTDDQLAALRRLYELPKRHSGTGGGNAAAKLLLGLYNGPRFPFDLTDLRCFDEANFEAAMTVLRMDAPSVQGGGAHGAGRASSRTATAPAPSSSTGPSTCA